jgi:membrane protease YdiL (CAAX protease family)
LLEARIAGPVRRSISLPGGVAALGAAALMLRPVSPVASVILVLVGAAALVVPLPAEDSPGVLGGAAIALTAGMAAFVLAAWLAPALAGPVRAARWVPVTAPAVAASIAAAVVEEALFRRVVYGVVHPLGVPVAVIGSALLFALVHVPPYGWATVPLNLTAGVVLGWQRAASGRWAVPAVTHAAANVMAFL